MSDVVTVAPSGSLAMIEESDESKELDTFRYSLIGQRSSCPLGVVMLLDTNPNAEQYVSKMGRIGMEDDEEAPAPEPFEWEDV